MQGRDDDINGYIPISTKEAMIFHFVIEQIQQLKQDDTTFGAKH